MKIKGINCHSSIACMLCISSVTAVYGGTMGAEAVAPLDAIYFGAFGGGGGIINGALSQQGTAYYSAAKGGPLAVNASGVASNSSAWLVGAHVGYRWPERLLNHIGSNWTFAPATEMEGYYLGGNTLRGDDLNNSTTRLTEHDFHVSYPMRTGVFLVNAILNATHADLGKYHPYVGIGIGTAVVSISGANSTQKTPAEPGINHYNSGSSDTSIAFAAQPKVGLSFNLNQNTNVFAEYRFLYLSATNFSFGSTVYPTHVATSSWSVALGSQYYNMGSVGVQWDL